MDFSFSELDLALRDSVGAVLEDLCGPDHLRKAAAGPPGRELWSALAGVGLLDALVPRDRGGLGLAEESIVLVLEAVGARAVPEPLAETMLVRPLLAEAGVEGVDPAAMISTDLGGPLVSWASDSDLLLLATASGELSLVEPSRCRLEPVATVDGTRRAARVPTPPAAPVLAVGPLDRHRAWRRGVLAAAAMLVGLGQAMLDMTVAYVSQRRQFGAPVGSFQAVKHHLAGAAVQLEFARPVVYRAAWSMAREAPQAGRDLAMAKAMAGQAAEIVGRACLQCHGAIGYTTEYDLHVFLKRSWSLARAWGGGAEHRAVVASALGLR